MTDYLEPDIGPEIRFQVAPTAERTLAQIGSNGDTGLSETEARLRFHQHGANDVALQRFHPLASFVTKFWGLSAWLVDGGSTWRRGEAESAGRSVR